MTPQTMISQSPGRVNLIGEHTAYNEGFVLPAAIDKKTTFWLSKNHTSDEVQITAKDLGESCSFDINQCQPVANGWPNYVMRVVYELQQLGTKLGGFSGAFSGNVSIGEGISSSTALACSLRLKWQTKP